MNTRKTMLFWVLLALWTLFPKTGPGLCADELVLCDHGASDYVIVLPENATPIQISAADELQKVFREMTGVELPIASSRDQNTTPYDKVFVIGPGKESAALLGDLDENAMTYDTLCVKRNENALVFTGHPVRGPLYAVDSFLEDSLGCRWWTSSESTIPQKTTVKIDQVDQLFSPELTYRESFYRDAHEGLFAVRSKCNGNACNIPTELGGHHRYHFFVHSFYTLIPPQKYFKEHPDWFPEIDGVRKVGYPGWCGQPSEFTEMAKTLSPSQIHESGTQLCLSNEEMRAELVKNAIASLADDPDATYISISQNDWYGFCTCPKCSRIAEEEGSQSGLLLRFVNSVAEEIEKVRPDIFVDTLAYQYTRTPPKVTRPRANVVVRLCSIECSFAKPLATDPENASFKSDIEGWSQVADRLFVWDYVTDFALYLLPFPNYAVWADNVRFYRDNHVMGLFEQGDYHTESGDFTQLRNWVMSKLLWNPDLDQRKLMEEFIAGYYAPELVPIFMDYFDTMVKAVQDSNIHLGIFRISTSDWMTAEALDHETGLFDQAEQIAADLAVKNPEQYGNLLQKVQRERIPLDLVWLQDYVTYFAAGDQEHTHTPADMKNLADSFAAKIKKNGITRYRESSDESIDEFVAHLALPYQVPATRSVPEPVASIPENCRLVIPASFASLSHPGEWTFRVEDPAALNGHAVMMPGNHNQWAINVQVPKVLPRLKSCSGDESLSNTWKIYALVRCEGTADSGPAMTMGVYDYEVKENLSHLSISIPDSKGSEYKFFELPAFTPGKQSAFWMAPAGVPEGLTGVWLDQLIFVRQ